MIGEMEEGIGEGIEEMTGETEEIIGETEGMIGEVTGEIGEGIEGGTGEREGMAVWEVVMTGGTGWVTEEAGIEEEIGVGTEGEIEEMAGDTVTDGSRKIEDPANHQAKIKDRDRDRDKEEVTLFKFTSLYVYYTDSILICMQCNLSNCA